MTAWETGDTMASRLSRRAAEEACQRAEELFVAGDVVAAHRHAREAQRLLPSLPGLEKALAAYAIHAVVASSPDSPDWHAVLGLTGRPDIEQLDATTMSDHDAIKKMFRRMSLLVHPDKNTSAAADGAFKLLCQACDALSAALSSGPRDCRSQILCSSCQRSFAKPVCFVDGSRCPWCDRRLTVVMPWKRGKKE